MYPESTSKGSKHRQIFITANASFDSEVLRNVKGFGLYIYTFYQFFSALTLWKHFFILPVLRTPRSYGKVSETSLVTFKLQYLMHVTLRCLVLFKLWKLFIVSKNIVD